jgi:hypothetical protein
MHIFVDIEHKSIFLYESCLWCASAPSPLHVRNVTIRKCPSCNADRISMTPILGD